MMLGGGGISYGRIPEKIQKTRVFMVAMQIKSFPSTLIRVSRDLERSLHSWYRERDKFASGDLPYNVNVS